MPNYCHLVAHGKRGRPVADGAGCVPMFWLAFGASVMPGKLADTKPRQFSRKRAVLTTRKKLDFYESLFPKMKGLRDAGEAFAKKLEGLRCDKLSVDLTGIPTTHCWTRLPLKEAIDAVRHEDADRRLVIPAESYWSPFTGETEERPEKRFESTRELLLAGCSVLEADLRPRRGNDPLLYLFGDF